MLKTNVFFVSIGESVSVLCFVPILLKKKKHASLEKKVFVLTD